MASQEDYANVVLALSTLAQAPVAAYPESGPMMLAKQGQDRAVAKLADEAQKKAQRKAKKKNVINQAASAVGAVAGGLAGGLPGAAIGSNLASAFTGGSIDPASLAASFAESKAATEGVDQPAIETTRRSRTRRSKVPLSEQSYLPDTYRY